MKKIYLFLLCALAPLFAQSIQEVIDNGDFKTAKKMVAMGEIDEIYCGKMPANEAVNVYGKIFKQLPEESFAACPNQFAFGYGEKVCSDSKALNGCTEVVIYLLNESVSGNLNAQDALNKVVKKALQTKAFKKPIKEQVDTTMWVACPKKAAEKKACIEECKVQADSLSDTLRLANCETKPEHFIETTITVSKPSPLFEKIHDGLLNGFWKSPMSSALNFSKMIQTHAKQAGIPDSLIPNLKFVKRWAEKHKNDSTALPGGELFRFCTAWNSATDSILTALEFETRCPVFENFVDPRDNQNYKIKEIEGVFWFVENLNYAIENTSMCYDRDDENCKTFGRLYSQEAALTACPEGSRLASDSDWKTLEDLAGGSSNAAEKLRSNGSDDYAFTVLFGGYANKNEISTTIGEGAYFWTEKSDGDRGVARSMFSTDKEVSTITVDRGFFLSVRCIRN